MSVSDSEEDNQIIDSFNSLWSEEVASASSIVLEPVFNQSNKLLGFSLGNKEEESSDIVPKSDAIECANSIAS